MKIILYKDTKKLYLRQIKLYKPDFILRCISKLGKKNIKYVFTLILFYQIYKYLYCDRYYNFLNSLYELPGKYS
ncbi:hypothetical protein EG339_06735 [Chryseobacterium bernardetii]|uniref:Uncharacterized protein n=1 Tax=Chryseobacterium bernardetii TaxID=1241978 RepID=A0A3G6T8Z9_9FLAO|nr:hypothetical protein EG339_06735 [Chryseobacterium bernardetii]